MIKHHVAHTKWEVSQENSSHVKFVRINSDGRKEIYIPYELLEIVVSDKIKEETIKKINQMGRKDFLYLGKLLKVQ